MDFLIVVDDKSYEEVIEERLLIVEQFGTLVSAFTGEHVGEPRLIISLYDSPILHVDFKFTTLDGLLDRVEDSAILYEENNCITKIYSKKEAHFPTRTYSGLKIDFGFGFITLVRRLDVENYLKQLIFYLFKTISTCPINTASLR